MSYTKTCVECATAFTARDLRWKVCSDLCRGKRHTTITGRPGDGVSGYSGKIPSGTRGAITELYLCALLLNAGYSVFRAMSQACFCDLVIYKEKLLMVEVKTGYKNKETGKVIYNKSKHDFDIYAVRDRHTGEFFFFDKVGKQVTL